MNEQTTARMTLSEHFEELRKRLLWALAGLGVGMGISWSVIDWLMWSVVLPLQRTTYDRKMITLSPMESILQYLKVSIIFGLLLASPWIAYQMWKFIGAGLYEEERKKTYLYTGGSVVLFSAGVAFSYFIMLPLVTEVLIQFDPAGIRKQQMQFSEYINFFFKTTLAMGISFQVPLIMRFLSSMGLVQKETWTGNRKYAIVTAFVLAAAITPPDPISMVSAGLPIILLYEIGILLIPAEPDRTMGNSSVSDADESDAEPQQREDDHEH